jgi:hypothetical protein
MESKIKKYIITPLLILATQFIIACLVLFLVSHNYMSINYEISLSDIIILAISSLVAVCIAQRITNRFTERRYEKEFIISDLKEIEQEIGGLEDYIQESATVDISSIFNRSHKIQKRIDKFKKTTQNKNIENFVKEVDSCFYDLFDLITAADESSFNQDGIFKLTTLSKCLDLCLALRKVIFHINTK